jgi:hypothetical protein
LKRLTRSPGQDSYIFVAIFNGPLLIDKNLFMEVERFQEGF